MALAVDTMNAYLKEKAITDGFVQQALTSRPFLDKMVKGGAHINKRGGKEVLVDLEYDLAGEFKAWSGVGDYNITQTTNETATEGKFPWGFYVGTDYISYKKWLEVEDSEDAIAKFAERRLSSLADKVGRGMELNLFSAYDGTSHTVFGLPDIISDSDPANYPAGLGDIAVADMPNWKAFMATYDSTKDLAKQMFSLWQKVTYYSGKPKILVTTMDILNVFAEQNYDKSGYLVADKIALDAGFDAGASFNGVPFVVSDQMPAGTIYFINTDYLKLVTHPAADFKSSGWKEISNTNPDKVNTTTVVYSLVCSKRNAQAAITGIS